MNAVDAICSAFNKRGQDSYGEGVNQLDHALQCAYCAERDGASPALIVATLLHDIGHLLHDFPDDIADQGIDTQHERLGSVWLSQYFGLEVSEPVRLHVLAKRYLATTQNGYYELLSDASIVSLKLQGGIMSSTELKAFEKERFRQGAFQLRQWDDKGKICGWKVPDLGYYQRYIENCVRV